MNHPLVSIALCTYNGAAYLREQITSVLEQTYTNLEIIVVDDCSTDDTWEILKEYEKRDNRIKTFRNSLQLGINKNFEQAVLKSSGDFVAFCDQDDLWEKNKIEVLLNQIQGYDLVYSDSEFIDDQDNSLGKKMTDIKNLKPYNNCLPFAICNVVSGHALLVRRNMLMNCLPFPPFVWYDWYIAFYVSCFGKMNYTDSPLVKYRQHTGNIIAAIKVKGAKKKKEHTDRNALIRQRLKVFNDLVADSGVENGDIVKKLYSSYQSFSIANNFKRSCIVWKYRNEILATKKRSGIRIFLFCIKMFFKIV